MLRNGDAFAGVGLLLLWMGGIATSSTPWLTWLNFAAAIIVFYLAAFGRDRAAGPAGTIAIGGFLIVAWIVAIAQPSTEWLTWGTFILAVVLLFVGITSAFSSYDSRIPPRITRPTR